MKKRLLSIVLTLCMLATLLPAFEATAQAAGGSDVLSLEQVNPLESVTVKTPYGTSKDTPFLLEEQNELVLYKTYNYDSGDEKTASSEKIASNDATKPGSLSGNDTATWESPQNLNDFKGEEQSDTKVYSFVSGVGFDATGSGRKDHVAYIGFDQGHVKGEDDHAARIVLWVRNVATGEQSEAFTVTEDCGWIMAKGHRLLHYEASNYLTITAGDYDGDGKDTLVVYVPEQTKACLRQYTVNSALTISRRGADMSLESMTGDRYGKMAKSENANSKFFKFTCGLTTGDYDGDGVDELAATVGTCNWTGEAGEEGYVNDSYGLPVGEVKSFSQAMKRLENFSTYLSVFDGNESGSFKAAGDKISFVDPLEEERGDLHLYRGRMLYAGNVAAGDVNGDGRDELIIAGYANDTYHPYVTQYRENGYALSLYDLNKNHLATSIVSFGADGYSRSDIQLVVMNKFTSSGFVPTEDFIWQKMAIACGNINGASAPAQIFLDGALYSVNGSEIKQEYQSKFFDKEFNTLAELSEFVDHYGVGSVTVGNFDSNTSGREQFAFTLLFKGTGQDDYYLKLGTMGGCSYNGNYGAAGSYYSTKGLGEYGNFNVYNKGDNPESKRCNLVPVAVDSDDDGVLAKFNTVGYAYSDPQVQAVLQAAPHFAELSAYDNHADGSTGYTVSTAYAVGRSSSTTTSLSYGFKGEMTAAAVKAGIEAGATSSFTRSFEQEYGQEYSTTFTATLYDTVIVQRTPHAIFTYDTQNQDKTWAGKSYQVIVPLNPTYVQLSVDDYNHWFYEKQRKGGLYCQVHSPHL